MVMIQGMKKMKPAEEKEDYASLKFIMGAGYRSNRLAVLILKQWGDQWLVGDAVGVSW